MKKYSIAGQGCQIRELFRPCFLYTCVWAGFAYNEVVDDVAGGMPTYRLPRRYVPGFVWSALAIQPRSFARDATRAIRGVDPPLQVVGDEQIPAAGPCLVVCNHYGRPGFASWWLTFSIQAAVAARRAPGADPQIRWVVAAAWTYPSGSWRDRMVTPLTRWAFGRVAQVYGFVSMPPMPPRAFEVEARAAAVLKTARLARQAARTGGMIGLAPQGGDVATWLAPPPPGAGEFIALLVGAGLPVLPVAVAEDAGRLRLSFGPIVVPQIPPRHADRDRLVSEQVMAAIGRLLPCAGAESAEAAR